MSFFGIGICGSRKDGFCSVCGCEMESVVHALWSCSAANDVWLQSGLSVQKMGSFDS